MPSTTTETPAVAKPKAEKKSKEARSLERFPVLDPKDAAWVADNARPASSPCLCGCGTLTKGRFAPGHDAILKERLTNTANSNTPQAGDAKRALATFGW